MPKSFQRQAQIHPFQKLTAEFNKSPDENRRRSSVQKLTLPDSQRTQDGVVAWRSDGVWIIPRL
jgi:hypothetical protein